MSPRDNHTEKTILEKRPKSPKSHKDKLSESYSESTSGISDSNNSEKPKLSPKKDQKTPRAITNSESSESSSSIPISPGKRRRDMQRGATVHGNLTTSSQNKFLEQNLSPVKDDSSLYPGVLNPVSNSRLNFNFTREEQNLERLKLLFKKLGYVEFVDVFIANGIVSLQKILEMKNDDWTNLGVKPILKAKICANARDMLGKFY